MSVEINATNFPDEEFRAYVSANFDKNNDGVLSDTEIENAKEIIITSNTISTLEGLKYFSNLTKLIVHSSSLTTLGLGNGSSSLGSLYDIRSKLKVVDLENCSALADDLYLHDDALRYIETFNITGCSSITGVNIDREYELTNKSNPEYSAGVLYLDFTGCRSISKINCRYQSLQFITFDENEYNQLRRINVSNNYLTELILPNASNLLQLYCDDNDIPNINISDCGKLTRIVNLSKNNKKTYAGYNKNKQPYSYYAYEYDGGGFDSGSITFDRTTQVGFVDYIPIDEEHFPDPVFRSMVPTTEHNGTRILYDDTDIFCKNTSNINDTEEDKAIKEYRKGLRSLEGIGYLTRLRTLYLDTFPNLEDLGDIYKCVDIQEIRIYKNTKITTLDVSMFKKLAVLIINSSSIETLIMGEHPNLHYVLINGCTYNKPFAPLNSLDFSKCPKLQTLEICGVSISKIDLSGCGQSLSRLSIHSTLLENLNLLKCEGLQYLGAYDNEARMYDISHCPDVLKWIEVLTNGTYPYDDGVDVGFFGKISEGHYVARLISNGEATRGIRYGPYPETTLITDIITINRHPKDDILIRGQTTNFAVRFTVLGTPSVQWYSKKVIDIDWVPIDTGFNLTKVNESGTYQTVLSLEATKDLDSTVYYCAISTDYDETVNKKTNSARLTVVYEPELIKSPESITVDNPYYMQTVDFVAEIAGGDLLFEWQYSTDNSNWNKLEETLIDTNPQTGEQYLDNTEELSMDETQTHYISKLSVIASKEKNGYYYRCVAWNSDEAVIRLFDPDSLPWPIVTSNSAQLTVIVSEPITIPVIDSQPVSKTVEPNTEAIFKVEATGQNLTYQWWAQYSNGTTEALNGATQSVLSVTATVELDETKYYCYVSNQAGQVRTEYAVLHVVYAPIITAQPQSISVQEGENTFFSIKASGHNLAYQWQFSSDGTTWNDIRNSNSASLNILATLSLNGYKYRCVVTNDLDTTISNAATLTVIADTSVTKPTITSQPSSTTVAEGSNATFAVSADGTDISYQWQVFKNNQWQSIIGETNSSYVISATRGLDKSKYRCIVSNASGAVYTNEVTLTVSMGSYVSTPTILTHPKSVNVDLGEIVTFWVRADGGGLTYQWQKFNNGNWYDITGAISNTYTLTARTEIHNTRYRCVVTNTAGSVYSNSATLSIRAGQELSFYGYHSIIISGKNTYGEWEMYPTSRPHVAPPEVKTSYVDLPGADGGLDYTDLLTGEPRYGYRKGSWEFLLIPQDKWASVYRSLVNFLHGRQHTVILEDDPDYVYTGRLSVNEWQSAAHNSLITIDYILEPHARNISGEEEDAREAEILDAANELLSKAANAGMVIAKVAGGAALVDPSMLFEDGDNIAY